MYHRGYAACGSWSGSVTGEERSAAGARARRGDLAALPVLDDCWANHVERVFDHRPEIDPPRRDRHRPEGDTGEIEEVFDQMRQVLELPRENGAGRAERSAPRRRGSSRANSSARRLGM
jgi:hypothetical protein